MVEIIPMFLSLLCVAVAVTATVVVYFVFIRLSWRVDNLKNVNHLTNSFNSRALPQLFVRAGSKLDSIDFEFNSVRLKVREWISFHIFFYFHFVCVRAQSYNNNSNAIIHFVLFCCGVKTSFLFSPLTRRRSICSCHFTFAGNCSVIECDMIAMTLCRAIRFLLPFCPSSAGNINCILSFQLFSIVVSHHTASKFVI